MTPQEADPDLPMSVQESPVEVWVSSGPPEQDGGTEGSSACIPLSSSPPPQCSLGSNNREGTQPRPSTENWVRFTEHGPAREHKTQFPPQAVSPIWKLP